MKNINKTIKYNIEEKSDSILSDLRDSTYNNVNVVSTLICHDLLQNILYNQVVVSVGWQVHGVIEKK